MIPGKRQQLQIQPTKAKIPLPSVPIGAFKISTTNLRSRRDVPTPTAFIGNKRKSVVLGNLMYKSAIVLNRLKSV